MDLNLPNFTSLDIEQSNEIQAKLVTYLQSLTSHIDELDAPRRKKVLEEQSIIYMKVWLDLAFGEGSSSGDEGEDDTDEKDPKIATENEIRHWVVKNCCVDDLYIKSGFYIGKRSTRIDVIHIGYLKNMVYHQCEGGDWWTVDGTSTGGNIIELIHPLSLEELTTLFKNRSDPNSFKQELIKFMICRAFTSGVINDLASDDDPPFVSTGIHFHEYDY